LALGFKYKTDFAAGIKRALDYYSGEGVDNHIPLVPEIAMPATTKATARKRANSR
jgi:hypothetical protein